MSGDMIPTNDDEDSFEELQRESQLQRELQQKRAEELIEKLQRENEFKRSWGVDLTKTPDIDHMVR